MRNRHTIRVAALFTRADSVYKLMHGVEAWDAEKNAMTYAGNSPVVAHPPCRLFSLMRHFSTAPAEEKQCAHFAVQKVRECGGVLEHPRGSKLWEEAKLPKPGQRDDHGFTLQVSQFVWGHKAEKSTWLYICGLPFDSLPTIPARYGEPTHVIDRSGSTRKSKEKRLRKPWVSKAEREHTPPAFAAWLVEVARRIHEHKEVAP